MLMLGIDAVGTGAAGTCIPCWTAAWAVDCPPDEPPLDELLVLLVLAALLAAPDVEEVVVEDELDPHAARLSAVAQTTSAVPPCEIRRRLGLEPNSEASASKPRFIPLHPFRYGPAFLPG